MLELRDSRIAFTHKICELIIWAKTKGYDLAFDEGKVFQRRIGVETATSDFGKHIYSDRVHLENSFHYSGLAVDLLLYIFGQYQQVDCPQWEEIINYWLSLDPNCTAGAKFKNNKGDYNHFSWGEK